VTSDTDIEGHRYRATVPKRPDDDLSTAILDAARDLLAEEGCGALTVRRIAAAAGGSTMNVYSRFGGKDGVVDALLAEGFEQLTDDMRAVATTDDPIADLRGCARAYREFALSHQTHYELMFDSVIPGYEKSPDCIEAALGALEHLATRCERAMDAGLFRRDDPVKVAMVFWAGTHGPVSLELKSAGPPGTDWGVVHAQLVDAMHAGLRVEKQSVG
jgi:AcrR family transcriptional regulator